MYTVLPSNLLIKIVLCIVLFREIYNMPDFLSLQNSVANALIVVHIFRKTEHKILCPNCKSLSTRLLLKHCKKLVTLYINSRVFLFLLPEKSLSASHHETEARTYSGIHFLLVDIHLLLYATIVLMLNAFP